MLTETYRPETLTDIIGQKKAVKTLRKWTRIADRGALIFEGPSGVGKTSAAYALARELGISTGRGSPDFHKIEAAECSIQTIRELSATLHVAAWGPSGWRLWLIDEAHTMSMQARNRLLSVLEDLPPRRCVVLTTTEGEALRKDDAILFSRLLRIHFGKPHIDEIVPMLKRIAQDVTGDGEALPYETIVRDARSNVRLAIQDLERRILEMD